MLNVLEDWSLGISDALGDIITSLGWTAPILVAVIFLAVSAGVVIGHVLGSLALSRIAQKQGASRKMTVLCWMPFLRYFAIGKLAERCDARRGKKPDPWGRLAARVGFPVMLVASLLFWATLVLFLAIGMLLSLLSLMETVDLGDGALAGVVRVIAFVFVAALYVASMVLSEYSYLLIIVPVLVMGLCAVLSAVLGAVGLAISYVCYAKILREYFPSPVLGVLIAVSAVFGLFPITLLVASFKAPLPAVAYGE